MNMPSFTAEAALCTTRGHYQMRRDAINLATQTGHTISLSLGISDEGPIEVHSCRPGLVQIGEGQNMVCVDPLDPFGTGGHLGGGFPGSGGGGGGGVPTDTGGDGDELPPVPTHGCTYKQIRSKEAGPCIQQMQQDFMKGLEFEHYLNCGKTKTGVRIMACCQDYRNSRGEIHRKCGPNL